MLKVACSPEYAHPLPEGHRFPMAKYTLLPEQLRYEGTCEDEHFFDPAPAELKWVLKAHDELYVRKLLNCDLSKSEERATGFPLSQALVNREFKIAGGTVMCVDFALKYGVSGNIAGGTHHAFRDRGEGFCLLNDLAIASYYALAHHSLEKVLILDLDVHQGNGTASIFKDEPRVYTFSMHGSKNYPARKEKSDWDIPLPDHTDDQSYLQILEKSLDSLLKELKPSMVFYLAGVDVLSTDKLGRLGLSLKGCADRDRMVFSRLQKEGIPVVFNMGGGYSERIATIVEAHANTFRLAQSIFF